MSSRSHPATPYDENKASTGSTTKNENYNKQATGNPETSRSNDEVERQFVGKDSKNETPTSISQRKRRKRGPLLSKDEEVVFNYMTGFYEKVKEVETHNVKENDDIIIIDDEIIVGPATLATKSVEPTEGRVIIDLTNDDTNTVEPQGKTETNPPQPENTSEIGQDLLSNQNQNTLQPEVQWSEDISRDNLTCQICLFEATSKQQLLFHLYKVHLQEMYSLSFSCKLCDFKTNHEKSMVVHDKRHRGNQHSSDQDISLSENIEIKMFKNTTKESSAKRKVNNCSWYKCYDCDYKTKRKYLLQDHAIMHLNSKFKCHEHAKSKSGCSKCVYANSLLGLEKKILTCTICSYKTCRKQQFRNHQLDQEACLKTAMFNRQDIDDDPQRIYKCFDCSYKAKTMYDFNAHVIQHIGSHFKCDKHPTLEMNCEACIYQKSLGYLQNNIQICDICSYKAFSPEYFDAHRRTHSKKSASDLGQEKTVLTSKPDLGLNGYKCFDCNYTTYKKHALQQHAVRHEGSKFTCPEHLVARHYCHECIYGQCLTNLNEKMMKCNECDYKTCRMERFKKHKSNCFKGPG